MEIEVILNDQLRKYEKEKNAKRKNNQIFLNEFTDIKYFMNDLPKKNYLLNLESRCDIDIKVEDFNFNNESLFEIEDEE